MAENQDIPDIFKNASFGNDQTALALEKQAHNVIQNLADVYQKSAQTQIEEMLNVLTQARAAQPNERTRLVKEVFFRTAHDMKGQGSTFGYPLITKIGSILCDKIRHKTDFSMDELDDYQLMVDDLRRILKQKPNADNKELEQELVNRWQKG